MSRSSRCVPVVLLLVILATLGCDARRRSLTLELVERDASGVTGTVILTDLGDRRTRVQLALEAEGHPLMPVHIHAGHCGELTPQPRYPLEDVSDGTSDSEVAVSLEELETVPLAVNVHLAMDDWTTVACGDLPGAVALAMAAASASPHAHVHRPLASPTSEP